MAATPQENAGNFFIKMGEIIDSSIDSVKKEIKYTDFHNKK